MAGRSGALLAAADTARSVEAGAALARSIITAGTQADLLHRQRLEEDRRAAAGYFIIRQVWRPLPRLERLRIRLRLGLGTELGGTIESEFLFRPEVALRAGSTLTESGVTCAGGPDPAGAGDAAGASAAADQPLNEAADDPVPVSRPEGSDPPVGGATVRILPRSMPREGRG